MTASASGERRVTARHKSALLWGIVGALLFLVLHQGYLLLLDGQFLGVGPVAGVAVAVFAATTVASYYTAGNLEVFEPDAAATDDDGAGGDPDDGTDEWIWGGGE